MDRHGMPGYGEPEPEDVDEMKKGRRKKSLGERQEAGRERGLR